MEKIPTVYILANKKNGTLYIGVTSDLKNRIIQHKNKEIEGFTSAYNINRLVYYEVHNEMRSAIAREKQLKKWKRSWKVEMIEKNNADWRDLFSDVQLT